MLVVTAVKDENVGVLIDLSVWDTEENFLAAWRALANANEGIPFEELEDEPHKFYCGAEPSA